MPFYRKNVGKRKTGKKRVVRRKKQAQVSAPLKSYISRAISRNEETKFHSTKYTYTLFNSGISATTDIIDILPTITHGSGQSQRVGQRIRPTRMEITGYVSYAVDSIKDARMIGARLFVYQDKTIKCYTNNTLVNFNLLNEGGNSASFTGTPMNWCTPHNKDQFTWYADQKFVMKKPFGQANTGALADPSVTIAEMNPSLFHPVKIVLTQKQLPSVLIYDQTESASYPINFAPKISLGYCDLFNNTADTIVTQVGMAFVCTLYYKDA